MDDSQLGMLTELSLWVTSQTKHFMFHLKHTLAEESKRRGVKSFVGVS